MFDTTQQCPAKFHDDVFEGHDIEQQSCLDAGTQ